MEEKVSITCISRSPSILKDFMSECRRQYLNKLRNKTIIYKHQGNNWKIDATVDTQPLSTVVLNERLKETVIKTL
jgi:chaperone BCS1